MSRHGMVDADAEALLQRPQKQRLAAVKIGGVEPVAPVAGDGYVQVAQERRQPDAARLGIDARQHHHVAAPGPARCVHADKQHGEGAGFLRARGRDGKEHQRRAKQRRGPLNQTPHKKPSFALVPRQRREGRFCCSWGDLVRCSRCRTAPPGGSGHPASGRRR